MPITKLSATSTAQLDLEGALEGAMGEAEAEAGDSKEAVLETGAALGAL